MPIKKFRLSTHWKNEERKRRQKRAQQKQTCLSHSYFASLSLSITVSVQHDFSWTVTVDSQGLTSDICPLRVDAPDRLASVSAVCKLLSTIDDSKHCPGNPEPRFSEHWRQRSLTFHGHSSIYCTCNVYRTKYLCFLSSEEQVAHVGTSLTGV